MHRSSGFHLVRTALGAALGLASAALMACGAGGPGSGATGSGEKEHRFQFTRTSGNLVRIDTSSGEVWTVPIGADGGWASLGGAPSDGGAPSQDGRYAIDALPRVRTVAVAHQTEPIMRTDRLLGRVWLGAAGGNRQWEEISEPNAGEATAAAPAAAKPETLAPPITESASPQGGFNVLSKKALNTSPQQAAEDVEVVILALKKKELTTEMRVWAAKQLTAFDPNLATAPLLEALDSEEPEVIVAAIESLSELGVASAIPKILKLKQHADSRVRAAVDKTVVEVR